MQLYVGPSHVVSAEIAGAMAVPIENPADCEVRGVIRFLQADEILGYLAENASSRVELFCYTTMHVLIPPSRQKPTCVSNSIGTSSSILHKVRTWHRRNFSLFPKMKEHLAGKPFANDDPKDAVVTWLNNQATTWYEEVIHKLVSRYDKCLNVNGDYVER